MATVEGKWGNRREAMVWEEERGEMRNGGLNGVMIGCGCDCGMWWVARAQANQKSPPSPQNPCRGFGGRAGSPRRVAARRRRFAGHMDAPATSHSAVQPFVIFAIVASIVVGFCLLGSACSS